MTPPGQGGCKTERFMKTIFLHAGHGKTGSSFLQSAFALNVEVMQAQGLEYPLSARMVDKAASGVTTSGNRGALIGAMRDGRTDLFQSDHSLLFSGESLWAQFLEPEFPAWLTGAAAQSGHRLAMLFFLRDPVEYQISGYLQNVQQGLEQAEINAYLTTRGARVQKEHQDRVAQVIQTVRDTGIALSVLNYSRVKRDLLGVTARFLGLDPAIELARPGRPVNRSIGAMEVGMARGLATGFAGLRHPENRNYLKRAIDDTAELSMSPPVVQPDTVRTFSELVAPAMARVNALLDPDQHLRLHHDEKPREETPPDQAYGLRMAQEISLATLKVALENLGDGDDMAPAREVLLAMAAANPETDLPQLRAYANILLERKDHKAALPLLERLVTLENKSPESRQRLAKTLSTINRHDEALALARSVFEDRPDNERAGGLVVRALLALNRPDEALAAIEPLRARDLCPTQRDFWAYRAAMQKGDEKTARTHIEAACAAAPNNPKYAEAREALKPSLKRALKGVLKR